MNREVAQYPGFTQLKDSSDELRIKSSITNSKFVIFREFSDIDLLICSVVRIGPASVRAIYGIDANAYTLA